MSRHTHCLVAMVKIILLTRKDNLVARALVHENGRYTAEHRDKGNKPPCESDRADIQAISVPGTRENGADGSEGG